MKKYSRDDQALMASWALDCAERVLPLFVRVYPEDPRPRDAIRIGREWVATRAFSMPVIRGASLGAHAAAKDTDDAAASAAAHAAGQAVATAHVPQHAYGGAYYALKAIVADRPDVAEQLVAEELEWQRAPARASARGDHGQDRRRDPGKEPVRHDQERGGLLSHSGSR